MDVHAGKFLSYIILKIIWYEKNFNDYLVREYTQVSGSGLPLTGNAEGEEIV